MSLDYTEYSYLALIIGILGCVLFLFSPTKWCPERKRTLITVSGFALLLFGIFFYIVVSVLHEAHPVPEQTIKNLSAQETKFMLARCQKIDVLEYPGFKQCQQKYHDHLEHQRIANHVAKLLEEQSLKEK